MASGWQWLHIRLISQGRMVVLVQLPSAKASSLDGVFIVILSMIETNLSASGRAVISTSLSWTCA